MTRGKQIQSVERALAILERVAQAPDGLPLCDLAAALELSATTVHNLAATLVNRGYLAKLSAPKRYALGSAARALAGGSSQQANLKKLERAVRWLASRWPQATTTATYPLSHEIATTLRISPEQRGVLQRPAHSAMPPYTSASALVFQAFWTDDERAAFERHYPFAEHGKGYWGPIKSRDRFLATIRREGCAVLDLGDGRLRIAVPVFDGSRCIRAALGLALPDSKAAGAARLVRSLQQAISVNWTHA
jgi:DNA-binding IclR family transcriptional regulator